MNHCKTCRFRDKEGWCCNPYLRERYGSDLPQGEDNAELIYSYDEGGSFWVGPMFGCVHHEEKK